MSDARVGIDEHEPVNFDYENCQMKVHQLYIYFLCC